MGDCISRTKLLHDIIDLFEREYPTASGATDELFHDVLSVIRSQNSVDDWIPVSERLPEPYTEVLACCEYNNSKTVQCVTCYDGDEWLCPYDVTYWRELPERGDAV